MDTSLYREFYHRWLSFCFFQTRSVERQSLGRVCALCFDANRACQEPRERQNASMMPQFCVKQLGAFCSDTTLATTWRCVHMYPDSLVKVWSLHMSLRCKGRKTWCFVASLRVWDGLRRWRPRFGSLSWYIYIHIYIYTYIYINTLIY